MVKTGDEEHFNSYRAQTRVKHAILSDYVPMFFRILKTRNKNLIYFDGFAGRGTYTDDATGEAAPGSPLLALQWTAENHDLVDHVTAIFAEPSGELFPQLEQAVTAFLNLHPRTRRPALLNQDFQTAVEHVLGEVKGRIAPTFLFVDPCGVSGTSFAAIKKIMDCKSCEAFIFFNVDGVRRIAGLEKRSEVLVELLGSSTRAQAMWDEVRATALPDQKEKVILTHYRAALNDEMGISFTTPFRVESADRRITSHYLIHSTKHPLGFALMKDVMWRHGQTDEGSGAMEFQQASRTFVSPLFLVGQDHIKNEIIESLATGSRQVSFFYTELTQQTQNTLSASAYKQAILALEEAGTVEVLDRTGTTLKARIKRMRKGQPTLGEDLVIRLS